MSNQGEQVFFNVPLFKLEPIFKKWVKDVIEESQPTESTTVETSSKNPFDDYILRSEIVGTGKAISDATAWKWEKKGKIQAYGIGGKRYYKRADISQLFTKVKKA